jgi:hypothetical protein
MNPRKLLSHPNTRRGYAAERLRRAAQLADMAERQKFLEEALEKYRTWAAGLGALPHRISADVAACGASSSPARSRGAHDLRDRLGLRAAPVEHSSALADLITSGDLIAVENDAGEPALIRAHRERITRYEAGSAPVLPAAGLWRLPVLGEA